MYQKFVCAGLFTLCFAWIAVSDVSAVTCSANFCPDMRDRCFESDKAAKGYLCCSYSKSTSRWLYKNATTTINCDPIKCYVCDSRTHPGCGSTFTYSDDEVNQLGISVTCDDNGMAGAVACKKMVNTLTGFEETIVTRSCYAPKEGGMQWHPNVCNELYELTSCYCNSHNCNGQERTVAGISLLILLLGLSLIRFY